jgi:hypothetical protein
MNKMEIERVHLLSTNHREAMQAATHVSCYFCMTISLANAVKLWVDNDSTALCPNCEIDAVIPGQLDMPTLEALNIRWFA